MIVKNQLLSGTRGIQNSKMEKSIIGIWMSDILEEIPNYNSNFTNWVDCICYKGRIKIEIYEEATERLLIMKIHVPVIYYGGIEGYACINKFIVDELNRCIREMRRGNEISDFIVVDDNTILIRKIYGDERKFSRLN